MPFFVLLTDDAVQDLEEIYDYIERYDGANKANYVLERIEKVFSTLAENPHRGSYPKELLSLGLMDFRQTFFKPYRIIYRVIETNVYILLITDGRRDMQKLLQRRLLQA
ncbi:MAG: type II toxin-antitoxin system RelE/ParE family toxin [Desulfobacteraceae bacterium]|nr:type II toxin-antitoxin system RelE/ParE family toxin [Desulfobacteraceae bacterium]